MVEAAEAVSNIRIQGGDEHADAAEMLAELRGEVQLGRSLSIEIQTPDGTQLRVQWHRSADGEVWIPIQGAERPQYLLSGDDAGCFLFAEWKLQDDTGGGLGEGSTEATPITVQLTAEERDNLKDLVVSRQARFDVRTAKGDAALHLSTAAGVRLEPRSGGEECFELVPELLRSDPRNPCAFQLTPPGGAALRCTVNTASGRDLVLLAAGAFCMLTREASHEGALQVWEGNGYGNYHGALHGQVLVLHEGATWQKEEAPTEALVLHGCQIDPAEADADEESSGFELSISDADGELFSLALVDEASCEEWRTALDSRNAPIAIARASHILVKHRGSRRPASWRDPKGTMIRARTEGVAEFQLVGWRQAIVSGDRHLAELAKMYSDCDTAHHDGDLGWFAAGTHPELEECVLQLHVGELSAIVSTERGMHLVLRTG